MRIWTRQYSSTFGDDWFALKAEAFARFFGTPFFLISQTMIVGLWIGANAAPLILLAQTRQADRGKVHAEADTRDREALADASEQRELEASQQNLQLMELLKKNTELTEIT